MFQLSEEGLKKVQTELKRYESRQSAIIPALYIAQKENGGYISNEVIDYLSKVMDLPVSRINEVFKFYTMFNQKSVGKYHVQICNINQNHGQITPQTCAGWLTFLRNAVTNQEATIIYYSDAPACQVMPTYGSAPIPGYIMLVD